MKEFLSVFAVIVGVPVLVVCLVMDVKEVPKQSDTLAKAQWMTFTNSIYDPVEEMRFSEGGHTNIDGHEYRKVIITYHRVGCPCGGRQDIKLGEP